MLKIGFNKSKYYFNKEESLLDYFIERLDVKNFKNHESAVNIINGSFNGFESFDRLYLKINKKKITMDGGLNTLLRLNNVLYNLLEKKEKKMYLFAININLLKYPEKEIYFYFKLLKDNIASIDFYNLDNKNGHVNCCANIECEDKSAEKIYLHELCEKVYRAIKYYRKNLLEAVRIVEEKEGEEKSEVEEVKYRYFNSQPIQYNKPTKYLSKYWLPFEEKWEKYKKEHNLNLDNEYLDWMCKEEKPNKNKKGIFSFLRKFK